MWQSDFKVPTFEEEIEMILGLNKTLGYDIGIYPEIKAPWLHRHEGKEISVAVLKVLSNMDTRPKTARFTFRPLILMNSRVFMMS